MACSAMRSEVAATAATGWPAKRTVSLMMSMSCTMLPALAGTKYTGVYLRFGTSEGTSTAFTPGSFSAALVSMRRMRACG